MKVKEQSMTELELGKQKLLELVKAIDPEVSVVIPVDSTNSLFLVSFTKGNARKFLTISEDDMIDLVSDDLIRNEVEDRVRQTISELK
jgi:hypothetical protein